MSVEFVVVDFVVRPDPEGAVVSKKKGKPQKIDWATAAEKVTKKVKSTLTKTLNEFDVKVGKCELEGALEDGFNAFAGVLVIREPKFSALMRIEDNLRSEARISEKQPYLIFKVQDPESKMYLNMQVEGFMLSGPSGGEWKPFDQWYEGARSLNLPD